MSEWWTYRLSDFLMFSPAVYARMVERYHRELWPLPWGLLAVGLVLIALAATRKPWAHRAVLLTLAVLWAWVGWAFFWQRYAQINWAAHYMAWGCWLQAALLAAWAMAAPSGHRARRRAWHAGIAIAALGVVLYPWHGQAFGLMPTPTALATLGLLVTQRPRRGNGLLVIPALMVAAEVLTLCAFEVLSVCEMNHTTQKQLA